MHAIYMYISTYANGGEPCASELHEARDIGTDTCVGDGNFKECWMLLCKQISHCSSTIAPDCTHNLP